MTTLLGADARHNSPPPKCILASRPWQSDPSEALLEVPSAWSVWRRQVEPDGSGRLFARAIAGTPIPDGWRPEPIRERDRFAAEAPLWFDASEALRVGTLQPAAIHAMCRYDADFELWSIDVGQRTYEGFKTRQEANDAAIRLSKEDWERQVAWIKHQRGGRLDWGWPIPHTHTHTHTHTDGPN